MFLPRDAMLRADLQKRKCAKNAVVVCPSVRLSVRGRVCLSLSSIVSKRLNVGSHK